MLIDTTELEARLKSIDDRISAVATPVPEVTQSELDALTAKVTANESKDVVQDSKIVQLSDLLAADQVEDDKQNADIIDLANRIGSGSPSSSNRDNDIFLDSFTGTDDDKLTSALTVAQASSPKRAIRLSARNHTFTKTRTTFSGLRILGPNIGWQNPEISGSNGALPQCNVTLNCGTAMSSWLIGMATTYDVTIAGICFKSSNANTQFYHHPYSSGTSYATTLDTLAFYGFKHVLGLPSDAFSMTLCTLKGSWSCVGVQDTQFSLRGSDNFLWVAGDINYGWAGANAGKYLIRFSHVAKTHVKHMYLTARGGSRAILVEGSGSHQGGLFISNCMVEGQNLNDPAMGALIVQTGGGTVFEDITLNFGMARPSDFTDRLDSALVMILGGTAILDKFMVNRANVPGTSTQVDVPVVSVQGTAKANIAKIYGMQSFTAKPRVIKSATAEVIADLTVTVS